MTDRCQPCQDIKGGGTTRMLFSTTIFGLMLMMLDQVIITVEPGGHYVGFRKKRLGANVHLIQFGLEDNPREVRLKGLEWFPGCSAQSSKRPPSMRYKKMIYAFKCCSTSLTSRSQQACHEVRKGRRPTERRKTNEMDAAGWLRGCRSYFQAKNMQVWRLNIVLMDRSCKTWMRSKFTDVNR